MRRHRRLFGIAVLGVLMGLGAPRAAEVPKARIPVFFDPNQHPPRPDLGPLKAIRFLTTDDDPPFHFALPDGTLAGFDVDLARAICRDLQLACTIQARRFDTLMPQIREGRDDALIAAIANTPAARGELDFTAPYYRTPGRFVVPAASKLDRLVPETLANHRVGVEAQTAHEAFLKTFFPKATIRSFPDQTAARAALQNGEVEALFGDGISLALWLNGTESHACCAFRGGPFTESAFFGNGVSIAVRKGNVVLREALDYELVKLTRDGTYADLYLKYFPIGFY